METITEQWASELGKDFASVLNKLPEKISKSNGTMQKRLASLEYRTGPRAEHLRSRNAVGNVLGLHLLVLCSVCL